MSEFIPLSVPSIKGNEWKYVKECIDTEWVSSAGKYVDQFEKDICRLSGAGYAIACVNGTAALQIALQLVGVTSDDEVIVPTITFIASVNAISYLNAKPVFMDCDDFYNIDVEKTIDFIRKETIYKNGFTFNKKTGKRIAAVIIVHVFGNPVNVVYLLDLCRARNLSIVEDAAESIGTYYTAGDLSSRHTGTIGDVGCYSFNGNKIITCGGGGMIVTNNRDYAERAKYLTTQAKDDPVRYIHHEIGYNFRLTNVQAALGVAQLESLQDYIIVKKKNYEYYKLNIDSIPGLYLANVPEYGHSNYWFYCLRINPDGYGKNREELMKYFSEHKIQTRPIWYLNHLQQPYKNAQSYRIEYAYKLYDRTLNIPCSVNITQAQLDTVIKVLKNGSKK
ncbi:MAG: LegC family aminotransferase [Candidatus Marinimicrobia bacterium]|nr:LegC family aminotransferase [bacterium]MCG2715323.1 LegC family aminotransferase [Candidatus Neomarinimicrobiota bacterium]